MSRLAVPQLLDAFEIRHAADFGRLEPARKHAFLKRLYKTLSAAVEPTRRELHLADGVELYFAARIRADGSAVDLPGDEALRAAVLLSERTLVTFSFHEVEEDPDGGDETAGEIPVLAFGPGDEGGEASHPVSAAEFGAFLDLLCRARPAMEAGAVHVLPLFPADRHGELRFRHETAAAHLHDSAGPAPWGEADSVPAVRLPSLAALPLERVLALREEAGPAYALRTAMAAILGDEAEGGPEDHLRALDVAITELAERLHEPADAPLRGMVVAMVPRGPDAALAAEELRAVLQALDDASRVRPLAAWRKAGAAEMHLPWQPLPTVATA